MKLSPQEQEVILQMRKKDDLDTPKLTAVAKTDIYTRRDFDHRVKDWVFTPSEKAMCIEEFANTFTLAIRKGDSFTGFIEEDGTESWYDDVNYGLEQMDVKWAKKYLTNIKPYPKNKIKKKE